MSITFESELLGGSFGVIVHGGAGDVPDDRLPRHLEGCRAAAVAAREILVTSGTALDAVQAAVRVLEDDPVFNAGTGACLTSDATLELDAAIMDGSSLAFGGICALGPFKNPIAIARAVLNEAEHVLYAGAGADAFARAHGFEPVAPESLITEAARKKLASALAAGRPASFAGGTVGAVARDRSGAVAAATSTGGMSGKRPGRVGDSPIPGAGTYADSRGGAASATGHGEGILRVTLTAELVHALRSGVAVGSAARAAIELLSDRTGMTGGVIAVDARGRLGLARSTRTMSWAAEWDGGSDAGS
jgi:beta-aspartyl-peptidase (threonine type)